MTDVSLSSLGFSLPWSALLPVDGLILFILDGSVDQENLVPYYVM